MEKNRGFTLEELEIRTLILKFQNKQDWNIFFDIHEKYSWVGEVLRQKYQNSDIIYGYDDIESMCKEFLFQAINKFNVNCDIKFGTYFFNFAKYKLLDEYKKTSKNIKAMDIETETKNGYLYELIEADVDILEDVLKNERMNILVKALDCLSTKEKELITHLFYKELKQGLFASKENVSTTVIYHRKLIAFKKVRNNILNNYDENFI